MEEFDNEKFHSDLKDLLKKYGIDRFIGAAGIEAEEGCFWNVLTHRMNFIFSTWGVTFLIHKIIELSRAGEFKGGSGDDGEILTGELYPYHQVLNNLGINWLKTINLEKAMKHDGSIKSN